MSTLLQPVIALEELVLQGLHELGLALGLAIVVLTLLVRESSSTQSSPRRSASRKLALRAPAPAA